MSDNKLINTLYTNWIYSEINRCQYKWEIGNVCGVCDLIKGHIHDCKENCPTLTHAVQASALFIDGYNDKGYYHE